jgi:hypothetical protein
MRHLRLIDENDYLEREIQKKIESICRAQVPLASSRVMNLML